MNKSEDKKDVSDVWHFDSDDDDHNCTSVKNATIEAHKMNETNSNLDYLDNDVRTGKKPASLEQMQELLRRLGVNVEYNYSDDSDYSDHDRLTIDEIRAIDKRHAESIEWLKELREELKEEDRVKNSKKKLTKTRKRQADNVVDICSDSDDDLKVEEPKRKKKNEGKNKDAATTKKEQKTTAKSRKTGPKALKVESRIIATMRRSMDKWMKQDNVMTEREYSQLKDCAPKPTTIAQLDSVIHQKSPDFSSFKIPKKNSQKKVESDSVMISDDDQPMSKKNDFAPKQPTSKVQLDSDLSQESPDFIPYTIPKKNSRKKEIEIDSVVVSDDEQPVPMKVTAKKVNTKVDANIVQPFDLIPKNDVKGRYASVSEIQTVIEVILDVDAMSEQKLVKLADWCNQDEDEIFRRLTDKKSIYRIPDVIWRPDHYNIAEYLIEKVKVSVEKTRPIWGNEEYGFEFDLRDVLAALLTYYRNNTPSPDQGSSIEPLAIRLKGPKAFLFAAYMHKRCNNFSFCPNKKLLSDLSDHN